MKRLKKTTTRTLLLTAALIATSVQLSCEKDPAGGEERIIRDVSYGENAQQRMDIYLPEGRNRSTTVTVVFIHGGGWVEGDKSEMNTYVDTLRKLMPEYAILNINYRLARNNSINLFPTQENDVKSAIEYYLSNADEYIVSDDLVLLGASAGGHLAMLHAFKNDTGGHVRAVVDFFGPFDLVALWNHGIVQQLILYGATGTLLGDNPSLYASSSPSEYITAGAPPTIALQGGADPLVPPSQSSRLIAALEAAGVVSQLVYYPDEGHGWTGASMTDSFRKIVKFISDHAR
ncbi:MAG: alpha/beta hydrolase [Bacteroidales bacterium]|jgi:acetyl esterase/lipase|nr:alpha/beta hydrolase [Bacteroidales bacterium]